MQEIFEWPDSYWFIAENKWKVGNDRLYSPSLLITLFGWIAYPIFKLLILVQWYHGSPFGCSELLIKICD